MVKLGELRIESNIPLIVLALSVICVVVIGFLELKKMTNRINELTIEIQNVKKDKIINEVSKLIEDSDYYSTFLKNANPYGNGTAATQIVKFLMSKKCTKIE